jgi:hypothetical protein
MIEGPEADTPLTPQPRGPEPRGTTQATHGLLRADGRLGPPRVLPIRSSSVFQSEKASCPFKSGAVVSATPSYFSISTLGMRLPFVSLFGLMACCPFRFSKKKSDSRPRWFHKIIAKEQECVEYNLLPPSQNRRRYRMRAGQTFSTLTRFIENTCNIYISK